VKKAVQEKAWKDFADWCASRGLRSLPAHPWTLAFYARWCEGRHRHPTIVKRLKAISRVHLLNCHKPPDRHPVVTRTVRILESRINAKRRGAALFDADDFLANGTNAAAAPSTASRQTRAPADRTPRADKPLAKRIMRSTPKLVSRRPSTGA
jgi:hypothetical protein